MTIFDHAWVQASFGQRRVTTTPTMKDYILGSEEFLIKFYELLETKLDTCDPLPVSTAQEPPMTEERTRSPVNSSSSSSQDSTTTRSVDEDSTHEEEDRENSRLPMDHGLTAHNKRGRTDLHFVNDLITDITTIHSMVDRSHRERKEKKLTDISKRLYHLHKNISKRNGSPAQRARDQEEFTELQRELRMDAEMLEAAKYKNSEFLQIKKWQTELSIIPISQGETGI